MIPQRLLRVGLTVSLLVAVCAWVTLTPVVRSSQSNQKGTGQVKLGLLVSAERTAIVQGQQLPLKIEIWNEGTESVFVTNQFESESGLLSALQFTLEDSRGKRYSSAFGLASDFGPGHRFTLSSALVGSWSVLLPNHLQGTVVNLAPDSYPELAKLGSYRISATYSTLGLVDAYHGALSVQPAEIESLPAKLWRGEIKSNSIAIKVVQKKS